MKKLLLCLLAVMLLANVLCLAEEPGFTEVTVHDPSIILAEDGYYYIYGSHMAAARSQDLIAWEQISTDASNFGCTLFEEVQTELSEALSWAQTNTFWAPDVIQLADGRYYYYYCCCVGNAPLSALGVAVSDRPDGGFEDLGLMLTSGEGGYDATYYPNVVDPCLFYDAEGRVWMMYGSYSGGIYILEIDENTGFPKEGQSEYGKRILGGYHSRIEAPYVIYNEETEYYYMFLSFGGLTANDGYNMRVCRSRTPDGPYVDAMGQDMADCHCTATTILTDAPTEGYGTKVMGGYRFDPLEGESADRGTGYRSPGHCSAIYQEETGRYFLVFHTRYATRGETHNVRVHEMFFNEAGWPIIAPTRYAGANDAVMPKDGAYKVLFHLQDVNRVSHASDEMHLNADGTVTGACEGAWECVGENGINITLDGVTYNGVFSVGYDTDQRTWVQTFTAMSEDGLAVWGLRATNQ